jgi:beta-barrel assembly-enhancing protease
MRFESSNSRRCGLSIGRVLVGLLIVAISIIGFLGSKSYNPITEEDQYVAISPEQEIALGLQAAPEMAREYGGLDPDSSEQAYVDRVCENLIQNSEAKNTDWPFECHLLADDQTINAFALPGGQVFITSALFDVLETEGQLAGVLAHEIGHVVARHSSQQIAKTQLAEGISGAVVVASYDPQNPNSRTAAYMAQLIGQLVNMKFGRDDELQSDQLGVQFMSEAGYDPRAMLRVMEILAASTEGAQPPEFFSTHPNPENRIAHIHQAIQAMFPQGVPENLVA